MSLKIVYAGTPEFSVSALEAIAQTEHQLVGVYTQPDRPAGRGKQLTASPVKQFALQAGLKVFQPDSFKSEESLAELKALNADVMVVTAYGLILPQSVLDIFPYGCINIHASLLPRWRGAAPIQRAIEVGDRETGVTIMQMDKGLDTGDMLLTKKIPINQSTTAQSLHDELMDVGAKGIVEVLMLLQNKALNPVKQDDANSTYAHKMTKSEGRIDWQARALDIDRKIRAFFPWPGTTAVKNGKVIKIIAAKLEANINGQAGTIIKHDNNGLLVACAEGAILVEQLQIPGKKRVMAKDLANAQNWTGESFDS
ncbi:MAG: methionyl-tRNA formyltransferase [Gammaproteobacteria bacterium]|nr:methionyl-tRNA formyltransferase [Gammaproteobacteria bacterium]